MVTKLNLGAGQKPMPGYVNVDLVVPEDYTPGIDWVQDDVTSLTEIADGTVEEIVAYHLLEHIPRSKVDVTLWTWLNKLQDGGKLILELPDIIKCCVNVLTELSINDDFTTGRLGLIGIFGDPDHISTNKYMSHQWGYSQGSLSSLLHKVGFSSVHFERPISKPEWSLARDMRCIAIK